MRGTAEVPALGRVPVAIPPRRLSLVQRPEGSVTPETSGRNGGDGTSCPRRLLAQPAVASLLRSRADASPWRLAVEQLAPMHAQTGHLSSAPPTNSMPSSRNALAKALADAAAVSRSHSRAPL